MEAQAAADEKPGDRDAIQALYKAQNRLPDFEEAFQEAEDYVHSLVVAGLSAKDGGCRDCRYGARHYHIR